jgi:hypothetical protein
MAAKRKSKKIVDKPFVVVRTYSAGVHVGNLVRREGKEVELTNARRVWRWRGANTLHELALCGASVTGYTRISDPVTSIVLTEVIEVIQCTHVAAANLATSRWLP